MADSTAIDSAIVSKLLNDATLMAVLTDGVYFDIAAPNAKKFCIVSLIDEVDDDTFGGRAIEDALYLVKAVILASSGANAATAAARIDTLLDGVSLSASGYTWMTIHREERLRWTEVDEFDRSIRWMHAGGRYRVQFSLT